MRSMVLRSGGVPISNADIDANFTALNIECGTYGADVASATTVDIGALAYDTVNITGTTAITSLGSTGVTAGTRRWLRFTGALLLTHGTNLVLPWGETILTRAGDVAMFCYVGGSIWRCHLYRFASNMLRMTKQVGYTETSALTPSSSTITIVPEDGRFQKITLDRNVNIVLQNPVDSSFPIEVTLDIYQDGTGSRTATFDSILVFPNGMSKVLSTGAGKVDSFTCRFTGDTNWMCRLDKDYA